MALIVISANNRYYWISKIPQTPINFLLKAIAMTVQQFNPARSGSKNQVKDQAQAKSDAAIGSALVATIEKPHHVANHNQNRAINSSAQYVNQTSDKARHINRVPKIGFVSLGCPKALVDSERIITELTRDGYQVAHDYNGADLVVVNTCGFIESAVQESLDAIGEAISQNGKVIVTGCLGKEADKIRQMHPAVLAVTGAHAYGEVIFAVNHHVPKPKTRTYDPKIDLIDDAGIRLTPKHYAYLKISEGCNHRCTFCIIPQLRGDLVSRPIDSVMSEAAALAKSGAKELLVISQDTSAYGVDLKYKMAFWQGMPLKSKFFDLCQALANLARAQNVWVRLHYIYPYPHVDSVVALMNTDLTATGGLLPYLDIPFQHAAPRVLKLMKRPAASENVLARLAKWREICPDIVIRSTFVVGFPGESEADFVYLLDWLHQARLDRVGAFTYSEIDGAPANELPDPVPEPEKQARYERLMAEVQQISAKKLAKKVGKQLRVVVDEIDAEENIAICRSYADAPDIDGRVYVDGITAAVQMGDWLVVTIDEASEYDLFAAYEG